MGDFNVLVSEKTMEYFLKNFEGLIKKLTCYKNYENPRCIGLTLTNRPSYFQQSNAFETGISDFHLLIATQLYMGFQKKLAKIIGYLDYKISRYLTITSRKKIFNIFDKHTPIKQKYLPANDASFMTNEMHRETTKRSRIRNNLLRNKLQEDRLKYNKQQNLCKKLLRTTQKLYFSNLDIKKVVFNRSF